MSGVQALNALAAVIHRAMQAGRQTPMGLAVAIDSAQMLMCPETAADLARLRARVAELEAERSERPAAEDPIAYALTAKAEDVAPQVQTLRTLLTRARGERA